MYSYSFSAALSGTKVDIVKIEADQSTGLPVFLLVGFLSSEVKEAKERVRIALQNSDYQFPGQKVTVNLSPADLHKEGTAFDLGIALSLIAGKAGIDQDNLGRYLILGELGLDGSIKGIPGVLPMVLKAREEGFSKCIVPFDNRKEASVVKGMGVYGVKNLCEAVGFLRGKTDIKECREDYDFQKEQEKENNLPDFSDVAGQELLKRAIEISVAGMHNLLMIGPPGAGKSMLAKRIPGIMPELTFEESMEVTKLYSITGLLKKDNPVITKRTFRSPHHSITETAMAGGGHHPRPGEISLAHRGVLFLDELPEFSRDAIECLRQPLEDGSITISRNNEACTFPADFMMVCAMNPCLCGYYPDRNRCSCTTFQRKRYIGKISRPILDRIDIVAEAREITYEELMENKAKRESSEEIRERVLLARKIQKKRYEGTAVIFNSQIDEKGLFEYCKLGKAESGFLEYYAKREKISPRACHRLLKVARTIADLEGEAQIKEIHLKEAVFYRNSMEKYWNEGGGANGF